MLQKLLVLYDGDCVLCQSLAKWVERQGRVEVKVDSWQNFFDQSGVVYGPQLQGLGWDRTCPNLRALVNGELMEGVAAWAVIISVMPELRGLHWLASRLGLTGVVAKVVNSTSHAGRRLCRSCRGR